MDMIRKELLEINEPSLKLQHTYLSGLHGVWKVEGTSGTPDISGNKVIGKDTFRWLVGGFFLVHEWDRTFNGIQHTGLGIIGYDQSENQFMYHTYDSRGYSTSYELLVAENIIHFLSDRERGKIIMSNGLHLRFHWERLDANGQWNLIYDFLASSSLS